MNITIQGTRLELDESLRTFIEEKLNHALLPLGDMNLESVNVTVEVELTTRRHPKERSSEQLYRAEVNLSVPGRLIRAEGTGPTARRAVVKMKHTLNREIRTWRGRVIDNAREGARTVKEKSGIYPAAEEET